MTKMTKGATLADVKEFLMTEEGPPPVDFSKSFDSAVISPGHDLTVQYKLPAGTYALLCFWPDASMGGMPHASMGMVRTIKLAEPLTPRGAPRRRLGAGAAGMGREARTHCQPGVARLPPCRSGVTSRTCRPTSAARW